MDYMTAEQAADAAKGLTFEKVWAALMESRKAAEESSKRMEEYEREYQKRKVESERESQRKFDEAWERIDNTLSDYKKNTEKSIAEMSKNLGGLGNALGHLTEGLFSPKLIDKFDEHGFTFDTQANYKKYKENGQFVTEVDSFLENGAYVMLVEIKTTLSTEDVDYHLERIKKVRRHMDKRGDARKILGTVAGAFIPEDVSRHAYRNGLFIVVQNGEAVEISTVPRWFKPREW